MLEMIVVVAIIGLLLALLLPVLKQAQVRSKRAKAESEVKQIRTAWLAYLNDYRRFPDIGITEMGPDAVDILRGGMATNGPVSIHNPRGIPYMEFRTNTVTFCDPWGVPNTRTGIYRVLLDVAGANEVTVGTGANQTVIRECVVVWSDGPNRQNEYGSGDDIPSWR